MNQPMHMTAKSLSLSSLSAAILVLAGSVFAQTNQITNASPSSVVAGATTTITFTLDRDNPKPPPTFANALTGATLGSITATSATQTSQYVVEATFAVPASTPSGDLTATITFAATMGPIYFTGTVAITGGAAVISEQPQGRNVLVGVPVTLSVTAAGSGLTYEWSKDGTTLPAVGVTAVGVHGCRGQSTRKRSRVIFDLFFWK